MLGYEAIVRTLQEERVDTVFALMSEEIIPLLSHVEAHGDDLRVVTARHEQGAAAMADGYARATGTVGVCLVGRGPAVAQTGTALVSAQKHGSRVLYVVPEPSLSETYDGKDFRQEAFLQATVGDVVSARSPETLHATVHDAFRRLRANDGPIALQVPIDVLNGEVDDPVGSGAPTANREVGAAHLHPDPDSIHEALEAYLDSDATRAPVIIAGRGAVHAEAKAALEALAERTNAFLATTLQARGYFDDHPFSVGFTGDLGSPLANEKLTEADFVFAVGCSLNPHTHDSGELVRDEAAVVHVDAEPTSIGRYLDVDVAIHGDATVATERFTEALAAEDIDRSGEFWTDRERERLAAYSPLPEREGAAAPGRMDPAELVGALDDLLPSDRFVVSDAGHFAAWVLDGIHTDRPDEFVWTADFVAIGQGLPFAVGAALSPEHDRCVAFCGDAGFMMALQELETAARHEVPLTVVVMNDDTLGAEYHQARNAGFSGDVAVLDTPDIAALADDLGADGRAIRSVSDLDAVGDGLGAGSSGPLVLDCKIDRDVRHRVFGG